MSRRERVKKTNRHQTGPPVTTAGGWQQASLLDRETLQNYKKRRPREKRVRKETQQP